MIIECTISPETYDKLFGLLINCALFSLMFLSALLISFLSTFLVATKSFQEMLGILSVYGILLLFASCGGMVCLYKPC